MTTTSVSLLNELQERGFTPDENGESWYDLHVLPYRRIRVELDDNTTIVHMLTGNSAGIWDVRFSDGTPVSVVASVIDLAIARAWTDS